MIFFTLCVNPSLASASTTAAPASSSHSISSESRASSTVRARPLRHSDTSNAATGAASFWPRAMGPNSSAASSALQPASCAAAFLSCARFERAREQKIQTWRASRASRTHRQDLLPQGGCVPRQGCQFGCEEAKKCSPRCHPRTVFLVNLVLGWCVAECGGQLLECQHAALPTAVLDALAQRTLREGAIVGLLGHALVAGLGQAPPAVPGYFADSVSHHSQGDTRGHEVSDNRASLPPSFDSPSSAYVPMRSGVRSRSLPAPCHAHSTHRGGGRVGIAGAAACARALRCALCALHGPRAGLFVTPCAPRGRVEHAVPVHAALPAVGSQHPLFFSFFRCVLSRLARACGRSPLAGTQRENMPRDCVDLSACPHSHACAGSRRATSVASRSTPDTALCT